MDKGDFARLFDDYKELRKKEQEKYADIKKDFDREYEHMEEKIKDALKELPVKED